MLRLEQACLLVYRAFGKSPILVGSVLKTPHFRDVDVRLVLPDDEFCRFFKVPDCILAEQCRLNPLWVLMCSSISSLLSEMTGLKVDFQIHNESFAVDKFKGERRIPLGLYYALDASPDELKRSTDEINRVSNEAWGIKMVDDGEKK